MEYILKLKLKSGDEYHTTKPGGLEIDNIQYIPGFLIDVKYNNNIGFLGEIQTSTADVYLTDTAKTYCKKDDSEFENAELELSSYESGIITPEKKLKCVGWRPTQDQFILKFSDEYPELEKRIFQTVTLQEFPAAPDSQIDKVIPIGFGTIQAATMSGKGVVNCPRVNSPLGGEYLFYRGPDPGTLVFPGDVYHEDTLITVTINKRSYTYPNGTSGSEVYIVYPAGTADFLTAFVYYPSATVLDIVSKVLTAFTTIPINTTSDTHNKFNNIMTARGFNSLSVVFDRQMTVKEFLIQICQNVGADVRFNADGSIELIAIDLENLPQTATHQTALILSFENVGVDLSSIDNAPVYQFQYSGVTSQYLKKDSYNSIDKKILSWDIYNKRAQRDPLNLAYHYEYYKVNTVDKFNQIIKMKPLKSVRYSMRFIDQVGQKPGNLMRFSHPDDLKAGTEERLYYVTNIDYSGSKTSENNEVWISARDLSHLLNLKISVKLSIHGYAPGVSKFYDSSLIGNVDVYNNSPTGLIQETVTGFPNGIGWRSTVNLARLSINQKPENYDLFNRHVGKNRITSFPIKLTDLTIDQCFICVSNTSKDSYWGFDFIAATKSLHFYLTVDGISIINASTAANVITDLNVHNVCLFFNTGNYGHIFVDGNWKKQFGTATGAEVLGICYIGIEKKFSGSYTKRFTGYMGEMAYILDENLLNCSTGTGGTCIVPVKGLSWEGIVS